MYPVSAIYIYICVCVCVCVCVCIEVTCITAQLENKVQCSNVGALIRTGFRGILCWNCKTDPQNTFGDYLGPILCVW